MTYAAGLARDYDGGGHSDWYLPSKDELNKLYVNRTEIGGLAATYYWSSSEVSEEYAWYQYFADGGLGWDGKSFTFRVRAVRAF